MGRMKDALIDGPHEVPKIEFSGSTYEAKHDLPRLSKQHKRVREVMSDGYWRTLDEIAVLADAPQQSVSARLRDLRKERFGSHTVERRHRGERAKGIFEYRLLLNPENPTNAQ